MANFFSNQITGFNTTPPTKLKVNSFGGRMRYAFGDFTNPAASGAGIGDIIYFLRMPRGSRVVAPLSRINISAGTASCTVTSGDNVLPARYLPATSITAAAQFAWYSSETSGRIPYEITDDSRDGATGLPSATNDSDLRLTVAGAVVAASQVIGMHVTFVQD